MYYSHTVDIILTKQTHYNVHMLITQQHRQGIYSNLSISVTTTAATSVTITNTLPTTNQQQEEG